MRVFKEEKKITVQVNGDDEIVEEISRKLDVNATLHVGGLPEIYQPREGLVSNDSNEYPHVTSMFR